MADEQDFGHGWIAPLSRYVSSPGSWTAPQRPTGAALFAAGAAVFGGV